MDSRTETLAARLTAMRAELTKDGLDGFIVPRGDEYLGEYVPPSAERLAWISGFTGSAGLAAILQDRAGVFSDGRYTLQLPQESPAALYDHGELSDTALADWLRAAADGQPLRLGFDPRLHTKGWVDRLTKALGGSPVNLVAVAENPLDRAWHDRPAPPQSPVEPHPLEFAGVSSAEKRQELAAELARRNIETAVITQPDSIAWLLNIRGQDVPFTPLPLSFALLHGDGSVDLFIDPAKLSPAIRDHLGPEIRCAPESRFGEALEALGTRQSHVLLDPSVSTLWVRERLAAGGAEIVAGDDPCALPKATKNATEIAGTRAAHRRDGVALTRFLAWLDAAAPGGDVTELSAAEYLDRCRGEMAHFRGPSFATISGAGPNGAIVHYRVTEATNRPLEPGSLYLVDSGGQYRDGTTDVTRTVPIGAPTEAMKAAFTAVLQGHIAIDRARFPAGTTGSQLDVLARRPLWEHGLDFDHGTGHGVGSYLSVHEGPQRIAKRGDTVALKPGMILSNEPGYYETDAFGIRIENLVLVKDAGQGVTGKPMLGFETLTLAPIDRRLILTERLSREERAWVDAYHARVYAELAPNLDTENRGWLARMTDPLAQEGAAAARPGPPRPRGRAP